MFGVIRGKKFNLNCNERREWMSHVCGLCLTLRAEHGQLARLSTNYDAALLSVLYEALLPDAVRTLTHYCPLRLGWRGDVIAVNPGTQFAASIALVSAAVKIHDHLGDGDGWISRLRGLFVRLAKSWSRAAKRVAASFGFDTRTIDDQAQRQSTLEEAARDYDGIALRPRDFLYYSQPTEEAVGAACGQVAVLAGCPERVGVLQRIGQLFGRIMYLVDAYRDYAVDLATRKFNPLALCFAPAELQLRSWALFRDAHGEIRERFDRLDLPYPTLARRLLIDQLAEVGEQTMGSKEPTNPDAPTKESESGAPPSDSQDDESDKKEKEQERRGRRRRPDDSSSNAAPILCCGPAGPDCSDFLCCYWLSGGFDCCDAVNCGAAGADCCATGQTADCCAAGAGGADCCAGADCAGGGAECCAGACG